LDEAESDSQVLVFHAGTKRNATGEVVTGGGRVLTMVGMGATLAEARERAYAAAAKINFEGKMMRTDIAARELGGAE
jgi:phosphoribosylamine--glycine ligase